MLRNFTFAAAMMIIMASPVHADDQPALISFKSHDFGNGTEASTSDVK